MTRRLSSLVIGAVVLAACAQNAPPPPADTSADVAAIKQMQDRELAQLASGNIDSMLANYTSDVVMMPPDAPAVTGHTGLRTMMDAMLKEGTYAGKYYTGDVQVVGDVGIVHYTGELTMTPKAAGAKPVTHTIKGLHIYKKQADGSWKIAQDVWNNDPPAAPPPK
jgi:uncharacterized protein (TIGR02246 family)